MKNIHNRKLKKLVKYNGQQILVDCLVSKVAYFITITLSLQLPFYLTKLSTFKTIT